MMKKAALHASRISVVVTTLASGSPFMACIRLWMAQPCGTSSETVSPSCAALGEFMAKMLIMPTMPVTVSTPPKTTPPCLVFLRNELTKMPNEEALNTVPRAASVTDSGSPHSIPKINHAAVSRTATCADTVRKTDMNLPPRMVACEVGVVNRRGRVRSSSSLRMLCAVDVPV